MNMTMNLKHSFIIVNTFKRLDGNIEKTVYDYGNKRNVFRVQFPFILSGRFRQIRPNDLTLKNEGILRFGWINVRAIFSLEE